MNEWKQVYLEDVANEVTVGFVGSMTSEYIDNGIPFLRSKNIEPFKINRNDIRYISREFHERIKKSALSPGDIAIVRTGNPGTATLIPDNLPEANCSDLVIVRPGPKINKNYLVYYLNSAAKGHISANLVGAVQQHFNVGAAKKIQINLPPILEQNIIASTLSSLDDKIDLLHRQNKTLEAMAETLFRQWFVEEAREDWEEGKLGDYFDISSGKGLKREQFNDAGLYPVLGANGEIGRTDNFLFEQKLIFTGRVGTLGNIFIVNGEKVWLSDNTLVFSGIKYFYFVYFSLKEASLEDYNVGSTQPLIRQSDVKEIPCSFPPKEQMERFESVCQELFSRNFFNKNQIKSLEKLRDGLLPKLMSGEVRCTEPAEVRVAI